MKTGCRGVRKAGRRGRIITTAAGLCVYAIAVDQAAVASHVFDSETFSRRSIADTRPPCFISSQVTAGQPAGVQAEMHIKPETTMAQADRQHS